MSTKNLTVNVTVDASDLRKTAEALIEQLRSVMTEDKPGYRLVTGREPRVGDYVKFNSPDDDGYITVGKYYEIEEIDFVNDPHIFDNEGHGFDCGGEDYDVYELVDEVTDEPTEEVEKAKETACWAKIGRKVDEYKVGDVVRVTESTGRLFAGEIGVISVAEEYGNFRVETYKAKTANWCNPSIVKLITPVEQRFDQSEVSE